MARIAELHPLAFSLFSRVWHTASFRSFWEADSVFNHIRLYFYQLRVAGEAPINIWRSLLSC